VGKKQAQLRPYWRWVLATYGPALLEALGTFRFLPTELVPLGLVLNQGGGEDYFDEPAPDDIPF